MVLETTNKTGAIQSLYMTQENQCITLKTELKDIGLLFKAQWFSGFEGRITAFPLFEYAVFDFDTGYSCIYAKDRNGSLLHHRDTTYHHKDWQSSAIFNLLSNDFHLWEQLRNQLRTIVEGRMLGVGPALLPAVAHFPGYDESFYTGIPYCVDEDRLPNSFRSIAQEIRTPKKAVSYFGTFPFSKAKTIRKRFFERPELMFYLEEHLQIFEALKGDINLFVEFLDAPGIFDLLQSFHQSPLMFCYCKDYSSVCSPRSLLSSLLFRWSVTESYAVYYGSRSEEIRQEQQCLWRKKKPSHTMEARMPSFSIPMSDVGLNLLDEYEAEGFRFTLMKTSREYILAAKALNNCLWSYGSTKNPVYLIQDESGVPVGAVEVNELEVVQAKSKDNKELSSCAGLEEAFDGFLAQTGLDDQRKWHAFGIEEDEDLFIF